MPAPAQRKPLKEKITQYRVLTQAYERLFPKPADRLWAVRQALDLSQSQFGEACELSGSAISRIECGYGLPLGRTLVKIVSGTGLSADFLLGVDAKVRPKLIEKANRFLEQASEEMVEKFGNGRGR